MSHRLSATNLAVHHHLKCDLFLYNLYHGSASSSTANLPSELSKARFERGNDWEATLLSWLDDNGLLLTVLSQPLTAIDFREIVDMDERRHFYVAGLSFWPPRDALASEFSRAGTNPVEFGIFKPDLLEITRSDDGCVTWRVIDAKASKDVKTSHHVQIFFYALCLEHLLPRPYFRPSPSAAVWLPPSKGFDAHDPSCDDRKFINLSLLSDSLKTFIFHRMPQILADRRENVRWHYNPLCRTCPYDRECRSTALRDGKLGAIPNMSLEDAKVLGNLLVGSHGLRSENSQHDLTDIEDLHRLISNQTRFNALEASFPGTTRKAKRVLGLPIRKNQGTSLVSATVEAARTNSIQVINRRNFTCPRSEDVSVILSLVQDPSSNNIARFCLTVFSTVPSLTFTEFCGTQEELVSTLASVIRDIINFRSMGRPPPRTQFYVFSHSERSALQRHLIVTALSSGADDQETRFALRLCIGALSEGADFLSTSFQPLILSGAMLDFLGQKGRRSKAELKMCLERLGLSTEGTFEQLRVRVHDEIQRLKVEGGRSPAGDSGNPELGQLPRVVVVKKEVEKLLALPIPGYWDLPECAAVLLSVDPKCPSDEDIFIQYRNEATEQVDASLELRNWCINEVLRCLRRCVSSRSTGRPELLVNEARVLTTHFMDICEQPQLRKLFFMQQFEVLAKLTELWRSRIDGCPDAPILEYISSQPCQTNVVQHVFDIISGSLDVPTDKDRTFYNYLLVEDDEDTKRNTSQFDIPVEALFDDLGVSGLVFPLNKYTRPKWISQHPVVQKTLLIADVRDIWIQGRKSKVTLRTWGGLNVKLVLGRRYRISPRLVDFNVTRVLSTLVELDFRCGGPEVPHRNVPFLELISDPLSFATNQGLQKNIYLKTENTIQSLFRELQSLGSEAAGALALKASQHRAARRTIGNRLSVIWGPPGTGKTYTIALSLLRLLDVQHRLGVKSRRIIFLTAMTHAAIQACMSKLSYLMDCYRKIEALRSDWLHEVKVEHVTRGNDHPPPATTYPSVYIYAGTVYQLYNFSKKYSFEVDCVIIDEAGQLSLSLTALVIRSLSASGRIVIAGDAEQLAPILTGQYPQEEEHLFGSILDCLKHLSTRTRHESVDGILLPPPASPTEAGEDPSSQISTIVQLTENFRLNPDLGEFVSTIYLRGFKPQKAQVRELAASLKTLNISTTGEDDITKDVRKFLLALSDVMLRRPQSLLQPPHFGAQYDAFEPSKVSNLPTIPHPISLALIRLETHTVRPEEVGYEAHVRGEAAVAAALVSLIRKCSPDDDIFVATPHRIQRQAVKDVLVKNKGAEQGDIVDAMNSLRLTSGSPAVPDLAEKVTVDTIERLQGSEAAFVICLFSLPRSSGSANASTAELGFLLERRRLNVAISRAKTLCLLLTSDEVLRPSVGVLANEGSSAGYAFLRGYEARAWSTTININLDQL